ncbi:hypothetical protein DFH08DRAFT_319183 [Mycena albidolilacea]|uniref:Uncharacterized protein n=1 Tax=Mycena albidolilacea TaxID=1033008 RepID=A0AAD7EIN8_9AGAR|nr:hypothetical protein DFH08DRAFT_319183 [Mycena albidolilacea]
MLGAPTSAPSACFKVDTTQPTSIQVRLADGTRLIARMNLTHGRRSARVHRRVSPLLSLCFHSASFLLPLSLVASLPHPPAILHPSSVIPPLNPPFLTSNYIIHFPLSSYGFREMS